MFCLPREETERFVDALRTGKIDPAALMDMTSAQRHAFFGDIVGPENALNVNALFESKLLLQNQVAGMIRWANRIGGLTPAARKDVLTRIQKLDKVLDAEDEAQFLADLANKKLGADVTYEEANNIVQLTRETAEKKSLVSDDSPVRSKERMDYGTRYVLLQDYVNGLKGKARELTLKEYMKSPGRWLEDIAGVAKSLVASLDNSFVGRQGIKMLFTHPSIWTRTFLNTWPDIAKALVGLDPMLTIRADVVSRPNALNGKYEAGKYDIGIASEEAYPSSAPEKIPALGRLFRASQSAYNGAALRMRSDYADLIIKRAEEAGIDTLDPAEAVSLGKIVNSITGRGNVPLTEGQNRFVNATVFSIRFLKSNFDTLTAHMFDSSVSRFAKKEAALNLTKIIGGMAAILWTAEQLYPGSVEWDARSSDFGKIRIGDTRFDISGGMGSLVTLASRIVPTKYKGEWGFHSKSSTTGKTTSLNTGKFGATTAMDVIDNFWQGKLSPLAGLFRDMWKGRDFKGNVPTIPSSLVGLVTPLSFSTFQELQSNPRSADLLSSMILESLGISVNTYSKK